MSNLHYRNFYLWAKGLSGQEARYRVLSLAGQPHLPKMQAAVAAHFTKTFNSTETPRIEFLKERPVIVDAELANKYDHDGNAGWCDLKKNAEVFYAI